MSTGKSRFFEPLTGGSLIEELREGSEPPSDLLQILAYHQRTKHQPNRYANGPDTLDWSNQPYPFRTFSGAPVIELPLAADHCQVSYKALFETPGVPAEAISIQSIGLLLELSMAVSAWKEYGPDRWALRCNPSSGNLHPTECYVIAEGVADLEPGVYHYLSRDHVLEQRGLTPNLQEASETAKLFIGLSSIHWREAWKYGERAFRYCQLDMGHAIGALRYSAAVLGWQVRMLHDTNWAAIAEQLGLDRPGDFTEAETEDAEVMLEIMAGSGESDVNKASPATEQSLHWLGQANILDRHPMYDWPVIEEVGKASRATAMTGDAAHPVAAPYPAWLSDADVPAAKIIRGRRSAQAFNPGYQITQDIFYKMLDALLPRQSLPHDVWTFSPRINPVLFVHRVEGLMPGLYILLRQAEAFDKLKSAFNAEFTWTKPEDCPKHLPLYQLAEGDCRQLSKSIHCHQAIGGDSFFAMGMLAEFHEVLSAAPWRYRQLFWEAGLIGQTLYLEAETHGIRGTGIGCYFDDSFHQLLGLRGSAFQSLYHFTVGLPITDSRISTLPAYPDRRA